MVAGISEEVKEVWGFWSRESEVNNTQGKLRRDGEINF